MSQRVVIPCAERCHCDECGSIARNIFVAPFFSERVGKILAIPGGIWSLGAQPTYGWAWEQA